MYVPFRGANLITDDGAFDGRDKVTVWAAVKDIVLIDADELPLSDGKDNEDCPA